MNIKKYEKAIEDAVKRLNACEMTDSVVAKIKQNEDALTMIIYLTEEVAYLKRLRDKITSTKTVKDIEYLKKIKVTIEPINAKINASSLELKKYEQYFCDHPLWFNDKVDEEGITSHCLVCGFKMTSLNKEDFEYGVHEEHLIDNINPYTYGGPVFDDLKHYKDIAIEYNIAMQVDELYEVRHAVAKNIKRKQLKKVK